MRLKLTEASKANKIQIHCNKSVKTLSKEKHECNMLQVRMDCNTVFNNDQVFYCNINTTPATVPIVNDDTAQQFYNNDTCLQSQKCTLQTRSI